MIGNTIYNLTGKDYCEPGFGCSFQRAYAIEVNSSATVKNNLLVAIAGDGIFGGSPSTNPALVANNMCTVSGAGCSHVVSASSTFFVNPSSAHPGRLPDARQLACAGSRRHPREPLHHGYCGSQSDDQRAV